MSPSLKVLLCCFGIAACVDESSDAGGSAGVDTPDTCDPASDVDGDGLDECTEEDLGLDPALADTDGDGLTDSEEIDCGTSALDASDTCYACGWGKNDPGDIQATGSGRGDVMENISLVDQCGEMVDIYDFAGEYHILYMTAAF